MSVHTPASLVLVGVLQSILKSLWFYVPSFPPAAETSFSHS